MNRWHSGPTPSGHRDDRLPEETDHLLEMLHSAHNVPVPAGLSGAIAEALKEASRQRTVNRAEFGRLRWAWKLALPAAPLAAITLFVLWLGGVQKGGSLPYAAREAVRPSPANLPNVQVFSASRVGSGGTLRVRYRFAGMDGAYIPPGKYKLQPVSSTSQTSDEKAAPVRAYASGKALPSVPCKSSWKKGRQPPTRVACFRYPKGKGLLPGPILFLDSAQVAPVAEAAGSLPVPSRPQGFPKMSTPPTASTAIAEILEVDRVCGANGHYLCWVGNTGTHGHTAPYSVSAAQAIHAIPGGFTSVSVRRGDTVNRFFDEARSPNRASPVKNSLTAALAADLDQLPVSSHRRARHCRTMASAPVELVFRYPKGERLKISVRGDSCHGSVILPWSPPRGHFVPDTRLLRDLAGVMPPHGGKVRARRRMCVYG